MFRAVGTNVTPSVNKNSFLNCGLRCEFDESLHNDCAFVLNVNFMRASFNVYRHEFSLVALAQLRAHDTLIHLIAAAGEFLFAVAWLVGVHILRSYFESSEAMCSQMFIKMIARMDTISNNAARKA